ncbi:hypothetical protein E9993_22195 [Labilibacter sediminis]|nr:hypothetical protein E9993_22195 [Labilibacter sediminis]
MKTQVNQHHGQLSLIALLVSTSILLLAFGIYKTIIFQNSYLADIYTPATAANNPAPAVSNEYGELLYSHIFSDEVTEAPLEIEEWMTDLSAWNTAPTSTFNTVEMEFFEEDLALEDWMTDPSSWVTTPAVTTYDSHYEAPLEIEDWMTELSEWEIVPSAELFNETEFSEPGLEVEPWMLNDSAWYNSEIPETTDFESSLTVEDWMTDLSEWNVPVLSPDQFAELNQENVDEELVLERWMTTCCLWLPNQMEIDIYEYSRFHQEDALVLEAWMLDDKSWLIEEKNIDIQYHKA